MSVVVTSRKKKGGGGKQGLPLVLVLGAVVGGGLWFWLGGDASGVTNNNDAGMRRPPVNEVQQNPMQDASSSKVRQDAASSAVADDGDHPLRGSENSEPASAPLMPPPAVSNHVLDLRPKYKRPEDQIVFTASDQFLAFALQGNDLVGMPPMPGITDPDGGNAAFLASLTNKIVILPDDPPELKQRKEAMLDLRRQMKEAIDNGSTVAEALAEYRNWVEENSKIRLEVVLRYQELKETDPEAALEYVNAANEVLIEKGITPIDTTPRRRGRPPVKQ